MIVGIHHVAIAVDDFDRALDFYTRAFGFEVVQTGGWDRDAPLVDAAVGLERCAARMAMLKAPNAYIELWQYTHPAPEDKRARPCDLGYPHFALQVNDIATEFERLTAAGMTFVNDAPVEFGNSAAVYGKDPFGNIIEIYEVTGERAIPGLTR